jgi:hypothetical protein
MRMGSIHRPTVDAASRRARIEVNMNPAVLPFVASVVMGLAAWGGVLLRYVWPRLRDGDLRRAAEPILYLHLFRYVGLAFLVPGVVDAGLDARWSHPAAWGDLVAALLAGLALLLGSGRPFRVALWIFSLWGTIDLLRAAVMGPVFAIVEHLHATYFIVVVGVPLLLWTHGLLFALLIRRDPRHAA